MFAAPMPVTFSHRPNRFAPALIVLSLGLLGISGCGDSEGLSKGEPKRAYKLEVVEATFPVKQRLAEPSELTIEVRNVDDREIPDLAVTVDSFTYRSKQPGLADPQRPIWTVNRPPVGSTTAFTNTYRLGKLKPRATTKAVWKVQAVRSGTYTLKYKIAAGLTGRSKAELPDGSAPEGAFVVTISRKPQS